jgi:hypothetical protein
VLEEKYSPPLQNSSLDEADRRNAIFLLLRASGIQLRVSLWQRRQRGGTEARIWHDPSWDDIRSGGVSNQTAVAFKLNPWTSFFTSSLNRPPFQIVLTNYLLHEALREALVHGAAIAQ